MTSPRSLFAAGLVVALLVGAALFLSSGKTQDESREIEPPPEDVVAIESLEATAATELVDVDAPNDDGTTAAPRRVAPDEPEAAPTAAVAVPVTAIAGVVIVEELDGTTTRPESGTVRVIAAQGRGGSLEECPIVDGVWSLDLERGADGICRTAGGSDRFDPKGGEVKYGAFSIDVDGPLGGVVVEKSALEARYDFGTTDVEIRVRRVAPVHLNVVDAVSGEHVRDVRIVAVTIRERARNDQNHPGDADVDVLVERADSPITLRPTSRDAARGSRIALIGSPGYAWERVEIGFSMVGERRIELSAGGALEVTVRGEPEQFSMLRLNTEEDVGPPYSAERLDGAGVYTFEGLAPGEYVARAELGKEKWFRNPPLLGRARATVVAGATSRIELPLEAVPEVTRAPVAGRVVIPVEWKLRDFHVTFRLLSRSADGSKERKTLRRIEFEPVGDSKDTWAFDLGEVQVGRWEMKLGTIEYSTAFDLGPEGRTDVLLVVPPPVEIGVFVREAATGAIADIDSVSWNPVRPDGIHSGVLESVEREEGDDGFRFRVPRGPVEVSCWDEPYAWAGATFDAVEGGTYELEVERAAAALLRMVDGDVPFPWPTEDFGEGEAIGHEGRLASRGHREGALWVTVTEPGKYRLQIPEINGYEPNDPIEIEFVRGETVERTISLTRKR